MAKKSTPALVSTVLIKYVAYYRVSTKEQGDSGLGLEAQRTAVAGFIKGVILAEYTEVESGKNNQRLQLAEAINRAKKEGAILIIAKLDRLSRNASFIFALRDSGVNFQCVDLPDANTLTIGIFASLAQHERELISARTKAALAAKIAQGAKLGKPENLTAQGQQKGGETTRRNAVVDPANRRAFSVADIMFKAGKNYSQIADYLNQSGFQTVRGCAFQATQVMRLLKRQQQTG
ncbi:recombinase family protein [Spirosoma endophyticum]|uniref:Site-specific DNA recombinase n=1 Tax=Spirosoma endophyticum TaxID=662367 RepID=A0A1I2FDA6_9BACT|nr:recombinase family protein [Spirosoma endophyticum]SFF03382.1 Site-specific DNA recombinase [Spirosoma endophyticum]